MGRQSLFIFALAICFIQADTRAKEPAGDLDTEAMLFAELPVVVSSARRPQLAQFSSVPISIITGDDIHYGGFTNVPEMLQFTPGIDILRADRNNVAVGVRGLHHQFSDRTLVLIDGRDATNPVFGGTDFFTLAVFPEDIERIEVVRGPGGAAWGANAFNGVINVILKEPEDVQGLLASTTVNEFGDTFSHLRWAHHLGDWSWRISGGYENHHDSDADIGFSGTVALAGPAAESRDFGRDTRLNVEAIRDAHDGNRLRVGGSYMHIERGDFEFIGFPVDLLGDARADERLDLANLHARLEHEGLDGDGGYLQWFGRFEDVNRYSLWRYQSFVNDVEGQWNFVPWESHEVSVGGNVRWVHVETERVRPTDLLPTDTHDEYWAGLFIIDTWKLTDRLTLESQVRGDYYSQTHPDWSGRFSALYALDESDRHVLRASVAKAFRAPYIFLRELDGGRIEVPPGSGSFLLNFVPADDLNNEQIYSLEGGYRGTFDPFHVRVDGYLQRYEELIGARSVAGGGPFGSAVQIFNGPGGKAYGAEVEVGWTIDNVTIATWYTYNEFTADDADQTIRAFQPARHKAGLSARTFLPHDAVFNLNYKFVDMTLNDTATDGDPEVDSQHRLDLTVSKKFADGRIELMTGVHDVLDQTDVRVFPVGSFTGHETPGRTFFFRVQARY